jgi:hypothetical protein
MVERVAGMGEALVVPVLGLNRTLEVLMTAIPDYPLIFHHLPSQKHPLAEHRNIKRKRLKEVNILLPIDF